MTDQFAVPKPTSKRDAENDVERTPVARQMRKSTPDGKGAWVTLSFRCADPLLSASLLLDIAGQFLQTLSCASFVVLGPNARGNPLEEERDGCSAVFGLKCGLHDHLPFERRIDRIKGDRFNDFSRRQKFHKPRRIAIFPIFRLAWGGRFS